MNSYYLYRWNASLTYQLDCIANGTAPDWGAFGADMLRWEQAWSLDSAMFPTTASGVPPLATAKAMASKYAGNAAANGFTAHVGMDTVEAPPAPPRWAPVPGSAGMGAVGDDCPFLAHGPTGSLAACEAGCVATEGCNAVNWSPSTPDCVYRACLDPVHPSLSPAPGYSVFGNAAAAPAWAMVPGSTDKAAVGADCPWIAKGPNTLEGCEAGCGVTSGCNAFNYNGGDCEWRACTDPMHPQLTPNPGWAVYGNAKARRPVVIAHAWHTDVAALAFLCETTPGCMGFNSNGKLTSNATALAPAPGVTAFVKNGAPQPAVVEAPAAAGEVGGVREEAPPAKKKPLPSPPPSLKARAAERRKRAAAARR